jgi:hypothetical protein
MSNGSELKGQFAHAMMTIVITEIIRKARLYLIHIQQKLMFSASPIFNHAITQQNIFKKPITR